MINKFRRRREINTRSFLAPLRIISDTIHRRSKKQSLFANSVTQNRVIVAIPMVALRPCAAPLQTINPGDDYKRLYTFKRKYLTSR